MINPVPQATSERIFSHKNKSNNSTKSNEKYYLILKRKDLHQYYCPHARHKNNPFVQRQNHLKNDNENLYKDNSFIANKLYEQQAQGRLVQRRLTKRSIDIIASNRNFLNADKTTTSTTTPSPSTGFSDTLPIWAPSLTSTSTTETPSMSSPPESINEIMNDVSNGTNNGNNNDLLNSPNFNITVETAVFVDESLYHILSKTFPIDTEQQIVLYVLTIMNAVQLLFKQPSLGRSVDISVVLMDLLRQQPKVCVRLLIWHMSRAGYQCYLPQTIMIIFFIVYAYCSYCLAIDPDRSINQTRAFLKRNCKDNDKTKKCL